MTAYRRLRSPGASYFFTVNLADRRSGLLVQEIESLRSVLRQVLAAHPLSIDAMVVLPDHLHALWTLPTGDSDYSLRWRLLKSGFSRALPPIEPRSASRIGKAERGIRQRRFWEHQIRDDRDYARHIDYIHINPVKRWSGESGDRLAAFQLAALCGPGRGAGRLGLCAGAAWDGGGRTGG